MPEFANSGELGRHPPRHPLGMAGTNRQVEARKRSIVKGISWRILATITTISLTYLYTGQIASALKVGATEFFLKFLIYYLHERAWNGSDFGLEAVSDDGADTAGQSATVVAEQKAA